jgi:hypothetical protein
MNPAVFSTQIILIALGEGCLGRSYAHILSHHIHFHRDCVDPEGWWHAGKRWILLWAKSAFKIYSTDAIAVKMRPMMITSNGR